MFNSGIALITNYTTAIKTRTEKHLTHVASVAKYYEEEFDTAVSNLSSLIEPIMIVFMGATIGGLMIALYSPIFNVGAIIN